ncbi:Protein Networked (NET), actin-binding (NAB) domain containing protein [Parasponia andersonii]|uniref:Protein Networked (NET), actin-binding (NAB) domain containing protein n=1 Tax=Parasponia andersonii TaxID=3476 RepID=A0A2P5B678_PARAD|nr:Protein Networked (NET), actin-binding (NAB) domain containing protein [Parasponia andersonii]
MLNRLREITKSFGNQVIDPEKTEQLKRTKAEIEQNVTRILKLIKNEDQEKKEGKRKASKKETELLGLVENINKECQSLYELYDDLISESRTKVNHGIKQKKCSSSSSSDSEYYSSEEIDINNGGKLEFEAASFEVAELKNKLASVCVEKDTLKSEYEAALTKIRQAEIINKDLKLEMDKKERELSAQVKANRAESSLARTQELEGQLAGLKIQLESLRSQKTDQEAKRDENKQVREKRKGWRSRVLELESILKDKEDENSVLLKNLEKNENSFTSKIAELMTQASNMQMEIDILHAQKGELEERLACQRENASVQVKDLMDQINVMKHEVKYLNQQRAELESQLERKIAKSSDRMVQIGSLNEELAKKILVEQKMGEEQKGQSLLHQKDNSVSEIDRLRLEREDQKATLTLTEEINNMERKLDSLKHKKRQLELKTEKEDQEHSTSQMKSVGKIADQDISIQKSIKGLVLKETKQNPQIVARKMEDLAEKFRLSFDNKLRLLSQRILVTEQLNTENKESYKKMKEKYEKENKALEEKVVAYETVLRNTKEISKSAECALNNLESIVGKFEKENGNFLVHIAKVSNEVQFAKRWVIGTTGEIKRLKHNMDVLIGRLDEKEEQESLLRDKVWKLEAKASKEGGEKLNLMQEIDQLEKKAGKYEKLIKEKEERLLSLGDEKREAIRQLCILVDYHRSRFDHLKQVVSKMSPRCRTRTIY